MSEILTKEQLWRCTLHKETPRKRRAGLLAFAALHRLTLAEILVVAAGIVTLCIVTPIIYGLAGWAGVAGLCVWMVVCALVVLALLYDKREPGR